MEYQYVCVFPVPNTTDQINNLINSLFYIELGVLEQEKHQNMQDGGSPGPVTYTKKDLMLPSSLVKI